MGVCRIKGCETPTRSRTLCEKHYFRLRRHGNATASVRPYEPRGATCSVSGCERPVWNRHLCQAHYWRQRRHGSTDDPIRPSVEERFWAKITKTRGCWLWNTTKASGYGGSFWDGSAYVSPYRFSYELHVGPIAAGLTIDHLCQNKACVRPEHLEAVPLVENIRRKPLRDRCRRGHVYTPDSTYITPAGYRQCRTCYHLRRGR